MKNHVVLATVLVTFIGLFPVSIFDVCWAQDCIDYQDYIHRESSVSLPNDAMDVAVVDGYAYVAHMSGLHIFDVIDPSSPQLMASVELALARSVAVQSGYVYVACNSDLHVVDVSSVTDPVVVGSLPTPGIGWDVEVVENRAYIAARSAGLVIVDISDPHQPSLVIAIESPHSARDVTVRGQYAFVADQWTIWVVDLESLASHEVASIDKPGPYAVSIAVQGFYAYVLDMTFGVYVYDISDPMAAEYVTQVQTAGQGGMEIADNLLYVGSGPGLEVFTLKNPQDPVLVGAANASYEWVNGLTVAGSYVFVTNATVNMLDIFDVANHNQPQPVGQTEFFRWNTRLALTDTHAYVACRQSGFAVVDITNPTAPEHILDVPGIDSARMVELADDYAYVIGYSIGLQVVDISIPLESELVTTVSVGGGAVGLDLADDHVYITTGLGLRIVDISIPHKAHVVGYINTPDTSSDVAVSGDIAVVADEVNVLTVDVSDPTSPWIIDSIEAAAEIVAVRGEYAYTASGHECQVFSIADPTDIVLVGSFPLPGFPHDITFSGDFAYFACVGGGMQVIDIADPTAPLGVGGFVAFTFGLATNEEYLFLTTAGQFLVYPLHCDLTAVPDPDLPGNNPTAGLTLLMQNYPNPFNPQTNVGYTLPERTRVSLRIYDVAGRLVDVLVENEYQPAGVHTATWIGCNSQGRAMPSGTYFYRLEAGKHAETKRMALTK